MANSVFEELSAQNTRGILLVLTGPTGAGKDTILNELLTQIPNSLKVITTTTRAPRPNETEGNPYHFLSREDFEHKIGAGELFEWVEFRGELYGTTKQTLNEALSSQKDILWRIDMKGVKNIKAKVKAMTNRAVFVFLTAPSIDDLEQRVKKVEGDDTSRWKPDIVAWEMHQYDDCDYLVVNQQERLEDAVDSIKAIMESKRREIIK